jgi:DNA-binding NarL/FixJ family response regulator
MIQINSQSTGQVGRSMASAPKIRILIAEDHTVMRYTLTSVLKLYPEIEIVGEATNGEDAVLKAEELQPAIVLMDINMPELDGIAATQRIKANSSRIAVIGLSVDSERYSRDAMLRAGAVAVVPKERATEDLYDAIQRAMALSL